MRNNKMNIPCCLASLLLVLVMITTYMTSGLYARYVTRSSSEDEARVAKFDVDVNGSVKDLDIVTSLNEETGEYQVEIFNDSEVVVEYEMNLQFVSGDTTGITGTFDNKEGVLDIGESKVVTLTFSVDHSKFTENKSGDAVNETVNFKVIVDIVQVD